MTGANVTRGFTLIETMVALGVFSIFLVVIAGTFSQFIASQKQDIGEQDMQEDARLALEIMNREIRTGYGSTYANPGGDPARLSFVNQSNRCAFFVRAVSDAGTGVLLRADGPPPAANGACLEPDAAEFRPLTTLETDVRQLHFTVIPADLGNEADSSRRQGVVTTSAAFGTPHKENVLLRLQTSITSRQFTPYAPV